MTTFKKIWRIVFELLLLTAIIGGIFRLNKYLQADPQDNYRIFMNGLQLIIFTGWFISKMYTRYLEYKNNIAGLMDNQSTKNVSNES
jgi:hypothetical protein